MSKEKRVAITLNIGDRVSVRRGICSPCCGWSGIVIAIDSDDSCGTYLVRLDNGFQFRYSIRELERIRAAAD